MIKNINIDLLVPFENHPFKKRSGIEQQELAESIKENGLLEPIIVRSFSAGKYEIISGHRRVEACKALGITSTRDNKRINKRRGDCANGGFKHTPRTYIAKRKSFCIQNEIGGFETSRENFVPTWHKVKNR